MLSDFDWKAAAGSNANKIENEINSLKSVHINTFKRDYKGFWTHVREINGLFISLKPFTKEARQRLWERFSSICEDVKRSGEDEKLKREVQSDEKRKGIKDLIQDARYKAKSANTREELEEAREMLKKAMTRMKDGWGGYNLATEFLSTVTGDAGILNNNDQQYCWEKWKEASDTINYRWQTLSELNYSDYNSEACEALGEANNGDPYEAQKKVKSAQARMKGKIMSRAGREDIFKTLDKAWHTASNKIRERKEEKAQKQAQWKDRMHSHIDRWESQVSKTVGLIDRIRGQIDDLEGKAAGARTPEFADTVRGWIQNKYDFINKLQDQIRGLEDNISSVKNKLDN